MKIQLLIVTLLFLVIAQFSAVAQASLPLRRPISPQQPMWLVHIDTWNYPDPQKIIALIPQDIRPFVVMNISLSISHNETTSQYQVAEYGYEIAKSWVRACAENQIWVTVQPSSGGFSQFSDLDLSVYEELFRNYPNFIGFNYAEQFWGYDSVTDPLSAKWTDRIAHFARLLKLCNQYGGYLVVSWCGNQWSPSINPIAMVKRDPNFAAACRNYTDNFILCEKYTQQSYQSDMESICLGSYLSGYAGQYGIRYDDTGWTDASGIHANFTMATGTTPYLEHAMLTGQTVMDGPELIWTQCFKELSTVGTTDGFTMRRWGTFPQFDNVSVDNFRKILDGTVRIPTRKEVIDRTKVVIVNNVNSSTNNNDIYSSPQTMFEGLYRMDSDGNYESNKTFFKKTGRYPTIPTVYQLDDTDANSFQVKVNRSAFSSRWPTVTSKVTEFDTLFPQEYTGDLYAGRHENGWVVYNPYKTVQTASSSIPFKYNTADRMELTFSQYTAGVVKEYSNKVTFYLSNYQNEIDTTLKTDLIKIYGSSSEPTCTWVDRASHQVSTLTKDWTGGVLTLTVQHNGALDITVNCSGTATGRLTAYTPAVIVSPKRPAAFVAPRQNEAECFDYKSIASLTAAGQSGSIRNYRGQGYLEFGTGASASVRDSVSVLSAGTYRLETRYAVTGMIANTVDLYVNGIKVGTPNFTPTATLSDWAIHKQDVTLSAGANTIEFRGAAVRASSLYFDSIVVTPTTYDGGLVIQENEAGFGGVNGTISNNQAGYTGTGYTNTQDVAGAGIDWWLDSSTAGTRALTLRYASLEDRVADLYVKGLKVASNILFPATGSSSSWELVTANVSMPAGLSNVRLQAVSNTGLPDIDFFGVGDETSSGSVGPLADVYVRDGIYATTNFGTSAELATKNDNTGFNRFTYLKFDVSGLINAQSVKLKLVPSKVDDSGAILKYDSLTNDSWSESAMTWNNRPTDAGTLVANVGGYVVGQQMEVDVTNAAKIEAAVDGTLTLRITNPIAGNSYVGFNSLESTNSAYRPVLEYTVAVPTVTPGAVMTAYLRFDEGFGVAAMDTTGNGWNGTLVGGPTWEISTNARINGALGFNGGSYVTLPAGIVGGLSDFSVSFWLKPGTISDGARVFDFSTGSSNSSMYFTPRTSSGMMRFAIRLNGNEQVLEASSAANLQSGTWTHVAVTRQGNSAKLYINGVVTATNAAMTLKPSDLGVTTNNFIGKSASISDPALSGKVDEFRIYNGAINTGDIALLATPPVAPANLIASATNSKVSLSWAAVSDAISYSIQRSLVSGGPYTNVGTTTVPSFVDTSVVKGTTYYYIVNATNGVTEGSISAEVAALSSPVTAYLRFDEVSGTTAVDSTDHGWDGTLVNSPTWVSGSNARLGGALKFSGSSHVTLPTGVVNGLNDCTVAFWVKLNSISTWARVFDFNNGSTSSSMYFVPRTAGGLIRFGLNGQNLECALGVQFAAGAWTHVAITLSGSTGTIYMNGNPVATNMAMTNKPSGLGNTLNNYIGKSASTADPNLDGIVDDFIIYEIPLSAAEIAVIAALPAGPSDPKASSGDTRVDLSWALVPGANTYTVLRSITSGGPYATIATVPGPGYTDNSVTNGTNYYYVITIASGVGQGSTSAQVSAKPLSTFDQWIAAAFPTENSSLVLDSLADPDNDRLPNLVEYYFGTSPSVNNAGGVISAVSDGAGNINFTYRMSKNLTGVAASVQYSTNLIAWTDNAALPAVVSDQGNYYIMRSVVPTRGVKMLFVRLALKTSP